MMQRLNQYIYWSLPGHWQLQRQVYQQQQLSHEFSGQASFVLNEQGLYYRERCDLQGSQQPLHSKQAYYYVYDDAADRLLIHFSIGGKKQGLFETLDFSRSTDKNATATAKHDCVEDHYQSHYTWQDDQQFHSQHQVTGPRKDYTVITQLVKINR